MSKSYQTILYTTDGPIATITLNRPDALNTIVAPMPDEVESAVTAAVRDDDVKVIVLRGAGPRVLCGLGLRRWVRVRRDGTEHRRSVGPGKDMIHTTSLAISPHQKFPVDRTN